MTTPTLNVNLKRCTCGHHVGHGDHCWGKPIPLPCSIPRTVEMIVRLGPPCTAPPQYHHHDSCNLPIRVTCTIGGDGTWAGSEIAWTDVAEQECSALRTANARGHAECLVRDRWEIVKALMTGRPVELSMWCGPGTGIRLTYERDAVFAALADLVHLDTQRDAALARAAMALGSGVFVHSCPRAEEVLGQYVSHLIAKIGAL